MSPKLVLCDCLGSQTPDADAIGTASGLACSRVYTSLCTDQIAEAAREMGEGEVIIACQQERPRFEALAEELELPTPAFVDIRDRAGWSEGDAGPKMAALVAEAVLPLPMGTSVDVVSEGTILILGGEAALAAAADLCDTLAVTVLLSDPAEAVLDPRFDCVVGSLRQAQGALGQFTVKIDGLREQIPGGRGEPGFTAPADGALSECDIILDLSGNRALFPAPEKREGYLRADPTHAPSVAGAVRTAAQLVGTFEKPLYVRLEPALCAHSRAEQPACSRCLDICPTGAISPAGEHVSVDPMICAGCGGCSAVCPSGAISYDAPPVGTVFQRLNTLAATYRKAGGGTPRLLVHEAEHGRELISLGARYFRGLPTDLIPLEVEALAGFGHAEMMGALACGFGRVEILLAPKSDREVIEAQVALARAMAGAERIALIDTDDPEDLCDRVHAEDTSGPACEPVLPLGSRRQITRLAAKALAPDVETLTLPEGAPYGAVLVDSDACTLCLSCVSLCPSGALGDNPDMPQLRFQEDACLQCGLCQNICPEKAITLKPQMNLTDAALSQRVLHEEEPFACIECGALFGVKSTVERITEKLAGSHSMFKTSEAARMIQMCDNCRIQAQFHSQNNPFQGKERPRPRTTEDYFSKRKDH